MADTCVLMPAYNVGKTIGSLLDYLSDNAISVIVVDDCSRDNTARIAKDKGAFLIQHEENKGKGQTLKDGLEYIKKQNYKHIVLMDSDGQHNPKHVLEFFRYAREHNSDMIIGNRMHSPKDMPFVRRMTNKIMSSVISSVCKQKVPDTQCGFRYLSMDVARSLEFYTSNFEIESEMIINAARSGYRIDSMPVDVIYEDEKSNINPIVDTWRFWAFMAKVVFKTSAKPPRKGEDQNR